MSTYTSNNEDMLKKKSTNPEPAPAAKNPPGRPKTLPPDLDKRHQLRCSSREFKVWVKKAKASGFPNVSAWIRKAANDAVQAR